LGNISPKTILLSSDMLWLQTVPCLAPSILEALGSPQALTTITSVAPVDQSDSHTNSVPRPPGLVPRDMDNTMLEKARHNGAFFMLVGCAGTMFP